MGHGTPQAKFFKCMYVCTYNILCTCIYVRGFIHGDYMMIQAGRESHSVNCTAGKDNYSCQRQMYIRLSLYS